MFGSAIQTDSLAAASPSDAPVPLAPPNPFEPARLLALHDRLKKQAFDQRWVFERDWQRDLYYTGNRQWISWHSTRREWIDKRLPKWVPKPVTNKMWETLTSIRTTLGSVQLSVKPRPVGNDTQSIAAAEVADQLAPLINEEHGMAQVMREADFWLIVTGNAVLQISWDLDERTNRTFVPSEQCLNCGQVSEPQQIVDAGNVCPNCGAPELTAATDPLTGEPVGQWVAFGKGKTVALSPFEYAFPPNITRWDDLPYIYRLRWRDKAWFEANRPDLIHKITWEKSPTERSLQLFKSLALTNDLGGTSNLNSFGSSASETVEGVTEYELWLKPTPEFPKGLVARFLGEQNPILLDVPKEGIPGPFPLSDIEGSPLFPFVHAQYEHVGGRLWGRSALSPLIQKQDQLNQLDSLIQLCVQRMSNPIWVVPEGSGVDTFSAEPGWVMKWNPLAAAGNAKPERIPGQEIPQSLMILREQIEKDIEELAGTFDIIKGQKPSGVEAFSALQLLVERSQSRFTAVFQSRGEMYRRWFSLALEMERQFGPQQRTLAVVTPNRGYTFKHFENAQLQGQLTIQIEDGSTMPKTTLGKRAAIEQANQLGLLNPQDPDQRYALLTQFGLTDLSPTLNYHVQTALQLQDEFEKWINAPEGPDPLTLKPWHDPQVHFTERIKWLNTDRMREILTTRPEVEAVIAAHLSQLQLVMAPPIDPATGAPVQNPTGSPGGGGMAMANSNQESGALDTLPRGGNRSVQEPA